jgi:hypothetical protein
MSSKPAQAQKRSLFLSSPFHTFRFPEIEPKKQNPGLQGQSPRLTTFSGATAWPNKVTRSATNNRSFMPYGKDDRLRRAKCFTAYHAELTEMAVECEVFLAEKRGLGV